MAFAPSPQFLLLLGILLRLTCRMHENCVEEHGAHVLGFKHLKLGAQAPLCQRHSSCTGHHLRG